VRLRRCRNAALIRGCRCEASGVPWRTER
jgi:hypothetical protein